MTNTPSGEDVKISVRNLNFYYGGHQALFDNNIEIYKNRVTAVIGPSGCGKSTHLRIYNRIYQLYREQRAEEQIQKPTPFPMSVFDNVAYGMRLHYKLKRSEIADRVEQSLRGAAIWDEVKDKLKKPGTALSGGQQQRLCIARAIAIQPENVHDRDRHPQHAAGGTRFRLYRILLQRRDRGIRPDTADVHKTERKENRRLHHRAVRLIRPGKEIPDVHYSQQ